MGHFTTTGKSFADGGNIDGFADLDHYSGGSSGSPDIINQTAPDSVLDGATTKRFLFWDTGRQVTTKRHVRWTFTNATNWSDWNAVAWYGTPGNGPPNPTIAVDSYWANNGVLSPTAIDAVTATNGPGGEAAWPYQGNDHNVRSEWGSGSIDAKDHLSSPGGASLNFSSLTKLVFGGDPSGVFNENDSNVPAGGVLIGTEAVTGQTYPFTHNEQSIVLASYVTPPKPKFGRLGDDERAWQWVWPWEEIVDPATLIDLIRERGLGDQIARVRESAGQPAEAFERLVREAAAMTKSQLTRAIAETRSIVSRGEAALKSLQAQAEKEG